MSGDQRNQQVVTSTDVAASMGELAQKAALTPRIETFQSPDGIKAQFAIIPVVEGGRQTVKLESLANFVDEYRVKPDGREGTANLGDLASLIAHVNRFKDPDSAIFADPSRERPSITAVLDYHRAGATGEPRFGTHRSHYAFPVSSEWKAWTGASGKGMTQAAFAEFIEARMVDVVLFDPEYKSAATFAQAGGVTFATPAQVLELSRGLSLHVESKVASAVNLQNGIKQIQFTESHNDADGSPLKIPGAFLIGIPVFRGEARYPVCVRLRYRKDGPTLTWTMELWRHEEVFDTAIAEACEKVKAATNLPLFIGSPE